MPKTKPLSLKQKRFAAEYAVTGNGTDAARKAGYSARSNKVLGVQAVENLAKPNIKAAIKSELATLEARVAEFNPARVKRRLHELSHAAQHDGQYGPAVRCEELLGKAAGMWIDQSLHLSGVLNDSHVAALVDYAKRRAIEPVNNRDDDDDD